MAQENQNKNRLGGKKAQVREKRDKSNSTIWVVVLLAIIIGLGSFAGWLLLGKKAPVTAESLFQFVPEPKFIFIDDKRLPFAGDIPVLLEVGEHNLEVAVPGYQLLQEKITVEDGQLNEFSFNLNPSSGVLYLNANTPVQVVIDGKEIPQHQEKSVELEAGAHTVHADGGTDFLPVSVEVEIDGKRKRQSLDIELIRSWAFVTVASDPPNGRVMDPTTDELIGVAGEPIKVMGREMPYQWILTGGPDYQPIPLNFTVTPDKDLDLGEHKIELRYARANISSSPPSLPIALNGKLTKFKTPHQFELPANGKFVITLESQLHETWSQEFQTEPNRQYDFNAQLQPLKGKLLLKTIPRKVAVYDGEKLLGLTPLEVEMDAGQKLLLLKRLGFQDKEAKLIVRPGSTTEFTITMARSQ